MKRTSLISLFLIGFIIGNSFKYVAAQSHPILGKLYASEIKGKVYLNWQIIAGSTCNGIQIYRSTDSINFVQIGSIPGLCGNISQPQNYDFIDNNAVKNQINYYRLELGNRGYSQIISLAIVDIKKDGYQIRPNPIITEGKIYFENNNNKAHQILIYDQRGIQVYSNSTKEDFFYLNTKLLSSGIYLFTISNTDMALKVKGKLLVQH